MGWMSVLHVFDMDGTLLAGSTASLELARVMDDLAELTELERRFGAGQLDTRAFSTEIHSLWKNLTPRDVAAAFASSPFLAGIAEVCADIAERGEHSLVITMSPDFYARRLLGFGFHEVVASRFPEPPFRTPFDPDAILTPDDKVRITRARCARHRIPAERCLAYGDSMSDAPLFRELANTVAVNADHHLADIAARSYRGGDLREAYTVARDLLG